MANIKYSRYYVYIKPIIGNKYVKSIAPYIFSLLAIIIFIVFAIKPTVLTITGLQKSIQDNQQILATLEKKSTDLTEGKKNYDKLDQNIKVKINTRLPNQVAVITLINDLQTAVTKTSTISALQVQPVTVYTNVSSTSPKQDLSEILFSFNVQDSYTQLLQTLDNLSKASRLINLTSVVLTKPPEGSIGLSVSGKAYYLK